MPKTIHSISVPLPGTEKKPLVGARRLGKVDLQERIAVTVLVRSHAPLTLRQPAFRKLLSAPCGQRQYLGREEMASRHGAAPADLDKIEAFAHAHELTVVHRSIPERRAALSGTLAALTSAGGVEAADEKLKRIPLALAFCCRDGVSPLCGCAPDTGAERRGYIQNPPKRTQSNSAIVNCASAKPQHEHPWPARSGGGRR